MQLFPVPTGQGLRAGDDKNANKGVVERRMVLHVGYLVPREAMPAQVLEQGLVHSCSAGLMGDDDARRSGTVSEVCQGVHERLDELLQPCHPPEGGGQ